MNDEAARPGRPATLTNRARRVAGGAVVDRGDRELALGLLIDLERDVAPRRSRSRCECGRTFEWPGLLFVHRDRGECPLARAAA